MYTYADLKKSCLQKLDERENTASGASYVNAMPELLNEALQYCATAGRFIIKKITITQDGTDTGFIKKYNLSELASDFYSLKDREIYFEDDNGYEKANNYAIEEEKIFTVNPLIAGTWTIYYNSYPQRIDSATVTDETVIDVADEVFAILPYHICGELLLANDEDYALERKSEFEQRRDELINQQRNKATVTVQYDKTRAALLW